MDRREAVLSLIVMWAVVIGLVSIFQSKLPAVTEGDVVVAAEPDAAYRAVTDYARWPSIFKNVRGAVGGENARVTFIHDDGSSDTLQFKNRADQRVVAGQADRLVQQQHAVEQPARHARALRSRRHGKIGIGEAAQSSLARVEFACSIRRDISTAFSIVWS